MARPIEDIKSNAFSERRMHQFTEKAHELEHEVELYARQTEKYIKNNPVKATIIAGVLGILVGKLLSK